MGIASLRPLASVEPDRMDQMYVSLRVGHRDVEKAPLFVDLFWAARRHIRWNATVEDVQYEDGDPLRPFAEWIVKQN